VAAHEELMSVLQQQSDAMTAQDEERMQYSSGIVTEMHQRLVAGMLVLKRDQRQLLQDKAQLQCELDDYERRCNTTWADGRRADDENRRLYQELEEREKMMQMMASDFDDMMSDSTQRFAAVSIKLDQPFQTTFNTFRTIHGEDVTFEKKFQTDLAHVLQTDQDRVSVLAMSKGSVVLETVLMPSKIDSKDQRPAWQLKSALKAMASNSASALYYPTHVTAKTVAITDIPEAAVLEGLRAKCADIIGDARQRDMLVGENHRLALEVDKLEQHARKLEAAAHDDQRTILELRNEISLIRNDHSRDLNQTSQNNMGSLQKSERERCSEAEARIRDLEGQLRQARNLNETNQSNMDFLQKSEAAERERCSEAEARGRDLEGQLRHARKSVDALEGQLAASNSVRGTLETKCRKMDKTMQQLQDTDIDLRRQLRELQDEKHQLERLSAQLRSSAAAQPVSSASGAERYIEEIKVLKRQIHEDMVPRATHDLMKAACSQELKDMARQVEEYQRRVADVNTVLARHAKAAVVGEFSEAARAEMQTQVILLLVVTGAGSDVNSVNQS